VTPLGLYLPGDTLVHRTPAGAKLLGLVALVTAVVLVDDLRWLGGGAALVGIGFAIARVPWHRLRPLLGTLLVLTIGLGVLQWWLVGLEPAAVVVLRLVTSLAAANLVTLTTRIDDVVAAVERVLRPFTRRADLLGMLVGLTVQAVSTLSAIAGSVREAAKARGAERSPTALTVPFVVRTLRHADELGEALAARGVGDD
jgi:biotin transport system permease protein